MNYGRPVKIAMLFVAAALLCGSSMTAGAEEFSFYGVRFGMTRAEMDALWLPLSGGVYALPVSSVRQVEPLFDHEGKLYSLSFLVDLPPDYPANLVNRAFSDLVESKWGRVNPNLIVDLTISGGSSGITVTDQKMRDAYIDHIGTKIAPLFQP